MITNALLIRIDTPSAPTASGEVAWVEGAAIAVDCFLDEISTSLKWQLGAQIAEASQLLFVALEELPAGAVIAEGYRLRTQMEDAVAVNWLAVLVQRPMFGRISHYRVFLQKL